MAQSKLGNSYNEPQGAESNDHVGIFFVNHYVAQREDTCLQPAVKILVRSTTSNNRLPQMIIHHNQVIRFCRFQRSRPCF
jgi:hypothetical protein